MSNELREILLCFYNGVHGNIDIRHGYPPIHMEKALDRLEALISTQIQEAVNKFHDNYSGKPEKHPVPCEGCGSDYWVDYVLPHPVFNSVCEGGNGNL